MSVADIEPPPLRHFMVWIRRVKPSRISVLCQMDETTLAALPLWLYSPDVDTHVVKAHTWRYMHKYTHALTVKGQVMGDQLD